MVVLIVLALLCDAVSAESHSLRIHLTSTTKIPNFPQLVAVSSMDGVQFVVYDSNRKLVPREQWMVKSEGAEWLKKLSLAEEWERAQKKLILFIISTTNQLSEIHTLQQEIGCDLRADGTTRGFTRYSWDGEDLLSLDEDHMEWDTFAMWAESIKHQWDLDKVNIQKWKYFLKVDCVQWLRRFLAYGKRQLRTHPSSFPQSPPQVTFTLSANTSHLSCLATGFRPSSIEVTLWKDRTILPEAHSSGLLPNHDGTHQIRKWVQIDPAGPALFSCRVEHSGLKDPIIRNYVREAQPWIQPDLLSSSSIFSEWRWISLFFGIRAISIVIILSISAIYRRRVGVNRSSDPALTSIIPGSSSSSIASNSDSTDG
ncbi:major histocompatibility complex class I-related gene protein-like [Hemitrygon akajei]|uniref:major histocompatibility complex class I-related gene protein-like n=1 Tax=Hemitrygon akajei TaxID=2704970 RepID=UPI003BF9605E